MLYINNKYFNLDEKANDEFNEIRKDFHFRINTLKKKFGDSITLETRNKPKRNPSGLLEPWQIFTVPLKQVVKGNKGSEEWLYSESIPKMENGYVVPDTVQEIVRYGKIDINLNDQPDKAYFLLHKHIFVKNGELKLVDLAADEEKVAEEREREAELHNVIYGKHSALNLDKSKLNLIAMRWGLRGVESLTPAQIKNKLYDAVIDSDAKAKKDGRYRTILDFLDDCRLDNSVKIGAVIQEAMDKGFLVFKEDSRQWCIDYQDGGVTPVLLSISAGDLVNKREILISHLSIDYKSLEKLENVMGKKIEGSASQILDPDIIEKLDNMDALRKQAKLLGINTFQMNRDTMKKEILAKLQET